MTITNKLHFSLPFVSLFFACSVSLTQHWRLWFFIFSLFYYVLSSFDGWRRNKYDENNKDITKYENHESNFFCEFNLTRIHTHTNFVFWKNLLLLFKFIMENIKIYLILARRRYNNERKKMKIFLTCLSREFVWLCQMNYNKHSYTI